MNLLQDYQVAKERISKVFGRESRAQINTIEVKSMTQQSFHEFTQSSPTETPLPKHQASVNNSLIIKQTTGDGAMTSCPSLPHTVSHQRIVSLTPQPTGARLRRPFESASALPNRYMRHHSTGAPPQHFYIR